MCQTYDPSRPIGDLFKQMQDRRAYAQAGQQQYGKQQIINIAYALIFNTGLYGYACKEWEKYDILEKTWESFKARRSWAPYGEDAWYVGPAPDHYRC
jgi:hypothetical protein